MAKGRFRQCVGIRRALYEHREKIKFFEDSLPEGTFVNGPLRIQYNKLILDYNLTKYWFMPGLKSVSVTKKKKAIFGWR